MQGGELVGRGGWDLWSACRGMGQTVSSKLQADGTGWAPPLWQADLNTGLGRACSGQQPGETRS